MRNIVFMERPYAAIASFVVDQMTFNCPVCEEAIEKTGDGFKAQTVQMCGEAGTTITAALKGCPTGMDFDWQSINASGSFAERDYVTNKLPTWMPILEPLRNTPLSILEIGSMEGRSALFFASYLRKAVITCVDPFHKREKRFDNNLRRHADRITKIRDFSLPALIRLRQAAAEFDLVYIDGGHERESVMMDSVLAWGMLKLGGMLIWDDYTDYKDDKANWERPTSAVDGFLVAYAQEFEEISRTKQLIVKKTADTPRCPVRGKIGSRRLKNFVQSIQGWL
ncbi:class I SAM-dependent methyltransferase [Mesorhizobium sp. PL10]